MSARKPPTPPAAVGLRAVPTRKLPGRTDKVEVARAEARGKLEADKDERKERAWAKLDAARRQAESRRDRLQRFQLARGGEGVTSDEDKEPPT